MVGNDCDEELRLAGKKAVQGLFRYLASLRDDIGRRALISELYEGVAGGVDDRFTPLAIALRLGPSTPPLAYFVCCRT